MIDVPADREMLAAIVADAKANAGPLAPSVWPLEIETASLADTLPGLVGDAGVLPIDADALYYFREFVKGPVEGPKFALGTLMDMALLPSAEFVCEVGGGHGRIAEAFLRRGPVHYVLIDAVPAVLMYAFAYLRATFPKKRIGSFYAGDVYGPEWECYVLPAWRADVLPSGQFDLCVNVESMQEMNAEQVALFFGLFDRLLRDDGACYISNARDWKYQGAWPVPDHWETVYQHNTPRSWTPDHPTFLYRKGVGDYTESRQLAESNFQAEMRLWDDRLPSLTRPNYGPPRAIGLPVVPNPSGNLTAIEAATIPFPVRRVFCVYDVPSGGKRGGHAHRRLQEFILAVSGSFDVLTYDEHGPRRWPLNRADRGVYVPPGVWRSLANFSSNAVALVLASTEYDETDYIRDFEAFKATFPEPAVGEDRSRPWFRRVFRPDVQAELDRLRTETSALLSEPEAFGWAVEYHK